MDGLTGPEEEGELLAAIVADGLGGHQAGEVASYWAVRQFLRSLISDLGNKSDAVAAIKNAYALANEAVTSHAPKDSATTLTMALVVQGKLYIGNVGDSRSYVISSDQLILRTKDHSFVRSLVDAGAIDEEEARTHPRKNIITRALGNAPKEPDIYCTGEAWDRVLLCSDGVCGVLSDEELMRMVLDGGSSRTIVERSLEKGGQDNSTAMVISRA